MQLIVFIVGIILLTGFAFGLSSAGLSSDPEIEESAEFNIGGVSYRFAPTTCTITENDFLAAGPGEIDGEPFWISASADQVHLSVGQTSEVKRPDDSDLWLVSVEQVAWEADERSITAAVVMRDERDTNAKNLAGSLAIECPPIGA